VRGRAFRRNKQQSEDGPQSHGDDGKAEADYRRAVELERRSTRALGALAAFYAGSEKAAPISEVGYDFWDSAGDERRAAGEMPAAKLYYSTSRLQCSVIPGGGAAGELLTDSPSDKNRCEGGAGDLTKAAV
jgi:hypothetical protein